MSMKKDWRFTTEGDLEMGSPKYDEFDQLIYVNSAGEQSSDSTEGELLRDIPYALSYMSEKQVIINRLKTDNPDWQIHPSIGANLSDLVGMPNSRKTGEHGEMLITNCLTADGFISGSNLSVKGVPVSQKEILFYVTVQSSTTAIELAVVVDLELGILKEYEV